MSGRFVASFFDEAQEYQKFQADDARTTAARLGLDLRVRFAEANAVMQIHQLFEEIHKPESERPALLVVSTYATDGLERVARNAVKSGVGWLLLNRSQSYLETIRGGAGTPPVACVTTDHHEAGRIQGLQIQKLLPEGGSILYVQGPPGLASAQARLESTRRALGGSYALTVMNGDWTQGGAERVVAGWLRLKSSELSAPDLVCGQNDVMALGARAALETRRPEWANVPFIGIDGLPAGGQRQVAEGRLAATVAIPSCAGPGLEIAVQALRSGAPPPATTILPPASFPPIAEIRPAQRRRH
jgi:ribose transport system substrate-binding protein